MFIDDIAADIPLKPTVMVQNGSMVDWDALDRLFTERCVYNKEAA